MRADFMPEYDRWFVEDSSLPVLLYENIEVAGREVEFAFACIELNADREGLYSRVYKDALSGQTLVVFND